MYIYGICEAYSTSHKGDLNDKYKQKVYYKNSGEVKNSQFSSNLCCEDALTANESQNLLPKY